MLPMLVIRIKFIPNKPTNIKQLSNNWQLLISHSPTTFRVCTMMKQARPQQFHISISCNKQFVTNFFLVVKLKLYASCNRLGNINRLSYHSVNRSFQRKILKLAFLVKTLFLPPIIECKFHKLIDNFAYERQRDWIYCRKN